MARARVLTAGFLLVVGVTSCRDQPKPEPENTVRLIGITQITTLDPAFSTDDYSGHEIGNTYEGLLQYHYLKRPYELVPNLAEDLPKISRDGKTYVFQIRKGVLFHDDPAFEGGIGRELTAEDFVYSFKRLADPKLDAPGWWTFKQRIVGLDEWREKNQKSDKTDYALPVAGLIAKDRYTLQITLNQPSHQFLYSLAMPASFVVPIEAVQFYGPEFYRHPVGTGPFRLDEMGSDLATRLVWLKSKTYRYVPFPKGKGPDKDMEKEAGKPLPRADRVIRSIYPKSQPIWHNFLSGKVDLIPIPKDYFDEAVTPTKEIHPDLKQKGIELIKHPLKDLTYEAFNMKDSLVGKNKSLRQAMSLAYNVEPLIELFYNGRAIAAQGPIPPGLPGYSSSFRNPYRKTNLGRAKELMKKAGYPAGKGLPPIEYLLIAGNTQMQHADYLKKSLSAIGIQLNIKTARFSEFLEARKRGEGQMWGVSWAADYPDAENFLRHFYSYNAENGLQNGLPNGLNDTGYSNPEFNRLFQQALGLKEGAQRSRLYQKMVQILVEDCPWIFGIHRLDYRLVQPWLKNYFPHDFDKGSAKYLRIDTIWKNKRSKSGI